MSATDDKPVNTIVFSARASDGDRLDSWKEIAVYLHREVRTVERWEKREGLPVHRHTHPNGSSVYAFKQEIDAWLRSRCPAASGSAPQEKHSERAAEWLSPTQLPGTRRTTAKSRAWLQNASAGVGSLDLLHGEDRIRLYFYVQLRGEQEANSTPKISGTRAKA